MIDIGRRKVNVFLVTLVALHFTPVSESVSGWVGQSLTRVSISKNLEKK